MGIFQKFNQAVNVITARESLKVAWSQPPKRTSDLWTDMYHKSPMMDPIHMIASDVAGAKYKIFNKAQYRRDPQNAGPIGDNPIFDLLDNPMPDHPEIDYYALMYLTSVYYEAIGEGLWLVDRDARGRPVGVYIIPPTWCLLTPTATIPYFRIQPMGNTSHRYFNADPADVVWFKSPDATNPYGRGRARAEAIGDEIETHEFSSKYSKNFFYNDATPPVIFEMPGIAKPAADEFKENWMQRVGGYLNARKPGIVAQKDFKVHQLGISPKEMDFTESRKYLIQMANEHFSVPPEMRGNLQNSNRATIDSAYYLWSKNVVSKRLRLFESILNKQFIPMFDKTIMWVFDEIVPEDNESKMKIANDGLKDGTITRNEWRKIASTCGVTLLPDEGRGDVYLTALMTQEVPAFEKPAPVELVPPVEPTPEPTSEPEKSIDLDLVIKEIEAMTANVERETVGQKIAKVLPVAKSSFSEDQKVALWKAFDKKTASTEKLFKDAVKKFAGIQSGKVRSSLSNVKTADDIKSALDSVFTDEADSALKRALAPAWLASLQIGSDNAKSLVGKKKADTDTLTNDWFSKWVTKNGLNKAKQINETTYEDLLKELQISIGASIDAGSSQREIVKNLLSITDGVYDNMSRARAELIARTESASSVNAGTYATYKVAGVQKKEWLSLRDDRTRGQEDGDEFDHFSMDGTVVDMDEKFDVGDEMLDYPGDPSGSAGNVCNCRCTTLPVLE